LVLLKRDPFLPFAAAMTEKHVLSNRRLVARWVGLALLLVGVGSAGVVYAVGESHSARLARERDTVHIDSRDDTLSFEDSKTSSRGTEMYFGKVGVLVATWFHQWEELKGFERLAIMIAATSVLASSICFLVANRLPGR
jgi:hypothetical protein